MQVGLDGNAMSLQLMTGKLQHFRDLVKERGLKLDFKIQSRADLLLEGDTIAALAESGLREVWIGAESGSQRILDAMDRGARSGAHIRVAGTPAANHVARLGLPNAGLYGVPTTGGQFNTLEEGDHVTFELLEDRLSGDRAIQVRKKAITKGGT